MTRAWFEVWPKTEEEFLALIHEQLDREIDYNTGPDIMAKCALIAFNYVAGIVGASGMQASFADLEFVAQTRRLQGPFAIVDGENLLYPQYDLRNKVLGWIDQWEREWAPAEAQKRLDEADEWVHSSVRAHWEKLASNAPKS